MSVLIKGGRIVTAADDYVADVYVEDETVTLIGESIDRPADKVVDASGKYLLPGCIDPHTHLDMPFGGTITADDFESGEASAAFGGTTTHIDFAIQTPGSTFAEGLETWHAKREGKGLIDCGFHIIVTDLQEGGTLEELATLPDQGITSYKLLMAYKGVLMVDDETLFRTMELVPPKGMSRCVCASMPPGMTNLPVASMVTSKAPPGPDPGAKIAAIFSPSTARSAA